MTSQGWVQGANVFGSVAVSAFGSHNSRQAQSGGSLAVSAGASAIVTMVSNRGTKIVFAGGLSSQTTISGGGLETLFGLDNYTTVLNGAAFGACAPAIGACVMEGIVRDASVVKKSIPSRLNTSQLTKAHDPVRSFGGNNTRNISSARPPEALRCTGLVVCVA